MPHSSEKHRRTALRLTGGARAYRPKNAPSGGPRYFGPYICFKCSKSFKRAVTLGLPDKVCPDCGGVAVGVSRNFKAPPKDARAEWKVVEYLVRAGFRFQHIRDPKTGLQIHDPYPRNMRSAKEFVRIYIARDA